MTTIQLEKGKRKLEVRVAENQMEIERTLALRYRVFNLEMNEGLAESRLTGKDRDEYDLYCDHLIVTDKNDDNRIVGTYRILRREIARAHIGFYSENEFNLDRIYDLEGEPAEIGRSCVDPEYRDGSVISMLWVGLGNYMRVNSVRYLMGCASIHTTDAREASQVHAYLRETDGFAAPGFRVEPKSKYVMPGFNADMPLDDLRAARSKVPPLLKGYLRAGARISSGPPALDAEFGTTDFFAIFNVNEVDKRYGRHYIES